MPVSRGNITRYKYVGMKEGKRDAGESCVLCTKATCFPHSLILSPKVDIRMSLK